MLSGFTVLSHTFPLMTNDSNTKVLGLNAKKEQEKSEFLHHMYLCAGRNNPMHPMWGLYTGLWHDFCIYEAGPVLRDRYFEMQEAIRRFEAGELEPTFVSNSLV